MKIIFGLLIIATISFHYSFGQTIKSGDIKTTGNCSPVLLQPRGAFEIICKDETLSKAELNKQAHQLAEVLSRLRHESTDTAAMIQRLDSIAKSLEDIKVASSPRRLSKAQQDGLYEALKPFEGTVIHVSFPFGDSEANALAIDFEKVLDRAHIRYDSRLVSNGEPIVGFYLTVGPDDLRRGQAPPQCEAIRKAISSQVSGEVVPEHGDGSENGECALMVGSKRTSASN